MFYDSFGDGSVQCRLCPWGCTLTNGARGRCRVRENRGGKLYSLVWGKPVAIHKDPIEKKPFYHFMPGSVAFSFATVGCNLSCLYCQNWEISQSKPEEVPFYDAPPVVLISKVLREKTPVVAYTYSEPIVFYEYVYDCSTVARKNKLRNVMISAGFINPEPLKKLLTVLDAVKIDLKAFNQDFYTDIVRGKLDPVLETLITIKNSGKWLEIVNLIVPGRNDSPGEIKRLSKWIMSNLGPEVPVHFTRFTPMYKMVNVPPTPVKTLEVCRKIAMAEGIKYAYVGNVPGHPGNNTYCPKCKKLLIVREAFDANISGLKNSTCKYCGTQIAGVWK